MDRDAERRGPRPEPATYSGRVLISGVGFIVAAAMWGLFGYFQHAHATTAETAAEVGLVVGHFLVGAGVLTRLRVAWAVGLAVALLGIIASPLTAAAWFPASVDLVVGLLLFFTRDDLR